MSQIRIIIFLKIKSIYIILTGKIIITKMYQLSSQANITIDVYDN